MGGGNVVNAALPNGGDGGGGDARAWPLRVPPPVAGREVSPVAS
jgi:hypothetical protein